VPESITGRVGERLSQFGGAAAKRQSVKAKRGVEAKQGESSFQFYRTISILFFLIFISRYRNVTLLNDAT